MPGSWFATAGVVGAGAVVVNGAALDDPWPPCPAWSAAGGSAAKDAQPLVTNRVAPSIAVAVHREVTRTILLHAGPAATGGSPAPAAGRSARRRRHSGRRPGGTAGRPRRPPRCPGPAGGAP